MKRFFSLLLILSLALSLTACGGRSAGIAPAAPGAVPAASSPPEDEPWQCSLSLSREEFPRLDGSTSMVPLGRALAAAVLGEDEEDVAELISFNRTTQSFVNLMDGLCDLLIVGEPRASVFKTMAERGFDYEMATIATDALIFVVNEENPVNDLTTEQIRQIYAGEITNWKELGGSDAPIAAFQRNDGAGSQALMLKLIMGDTPMTEAPAEYIAGSMGDLMTGVKNFDNSANAIGYSVYYYANDMKMARGLKILSVDGVAPSPQTIRSEEYPHRNAYYSVIPGSAPAGSPARQVFDWLSSENGQQLLARCGYVSVMDFEADPSAGRGEDRYTLLREGELGELQSGSYGPLLPYIGENLYETNEEDDRSYLVGHTYGLMDLTGRIITDPVYTSVTTLETELPMWILSRTEDVAVERYEQFTFYTGDPRRAMASLDGSAVTDRVFQSFRRSGDRIIGFRDYDAGAFTVFDTSGAPLFTEADLPEEIPTGQDTYITRSDGLYTLSTNGGDAMLFWYLDDSLRIVLGPYSYGMDFRNGVAPVQPTDSEFYGLMDKNGSYLIAPVYDWVSVYEDGRVIGEVRDTRTDVLDISGNILRSFDSPNVTLTDFGYRVYSDDYLSSVCYDRDGNVIFECGEGWDYTGLGQIFYHRGSLNTELRDLETGNAVILPGEVFVSPLSSGEIEPVGRSENWLAGYVWGLENDSHGWLIGRDLSVLDLGSALPSLCIDPLTGAEYILAEESTGNAFSPTELLDSTGASLGRWQGDVAVFGGCVRVTNNLSCTYYDRAGNVFFRRTLNSASED